MWRSDGCVLAKVERLPLRLEDDRRGRDAVVVGGDRDPRAEPLEGRGRELLLLGEVEVLAPGEVLVAEPDRLPAAGADRRPR